MLDQGNADLFNIFISMLIRNIIVIVNEKVCIKFNQNMPI